MFAQNESGEIVASKSIRTIHKAQKTFEGVAEKLLGFKTKQMSSATLKKPVMEREKNHEIANRY